MKFHVLHFHVLHFHVLQFHAVQLGPSFLCPAISCPAIWSVIFMSCNFMPCYLVRHFHVLQFHVRHFQRPLSDQFLNMHALFGIAVWRSNIAIVLRQFKSVLLDLFLAALTLDFCSRNGSSTLYERHDLLARQFFKSILNKNSCLNYQLPEERSDRVIGKLRLPSIFKLPHVHTIRSFINYL